MNSRHSLFMILGPGRPRSKCGHGWVLAKALFWVAHSNFSVNPHMVKRELAGSLASFYKGTNPNPESTSLKT